MTDQRNGDTKSSSSAGIDLDLQTFGKRLKILYKSWREEKSLWNGATAIAIASPPSSEDLRYLKSSALHMWLLGYEFPEMVMLFLPDCVHVLCSQKKAAHLTVVQKSCKSLSGVDFKLHPKAKSEDGVSQMNEMLAEVRSVSNGETEKLGLLFKEQAEGALMEKWMAKIESEGFETVDVSNAFCEIFAVKDETEISNVKKAAFLSASVLKQYVVPKMEVLIDEEKSLTHSELMELTEEVITNPSKIKVKLKEDNCDICFPPVFQLVQLDYGIRYAVDCVTHYVRIVHTLQSGGSYDLKASAMSNDDPLVYDQMSVIICAIGSRYASYCSNIARSYLIDASPEQERAYKTLLKAHETAIASLKPGARISEVYLSVVSLLEKEASDLLPHLTRNAGAGIGLEFRENGLVLNGKNERIIKPGMCFNVSIGFQGLKNSAAEEGKPKDYALLLADTIIVRPDKCDIPTQLCSKAFREVGYSFKDEDDAQETPQASKAKKEEFSAPTLRSENQDSNKEEVRRKHQAELAQKKIEETARRLASGGLGTGDIESVKRSTGDLVAYKNVDDIPTFRELMIQVDQKNEAVLLPIYGLLVPFHISTVKSVSSQQDGGHSYIRIIFNVPGAGYSSTDLPVQKCADSMYLKEISFRSLDVPHFNQVVQQIKTMGRQVKQRESARAERATLVTQEKLQMMKRPYKLPDLWIRPNFGGRGRKLTGALELHVNGFSYETPKMQGNEVVQIMFRNIKHAFFQPAENEMITLLHFHLNNPIMVGNKKTKDVQFYAEVMEVVQTVGSRRSAFDPDEIEEEQRERERRNKINSEFQQFVRRAQDLWETNFKELDLEFDIPFRELGFHGVPYKSSAFIVPTVNCLVELIETPFMVITLLDVEIVCLERVALGQKSMDMAIVFKDFKRDVMRIDAIPSTSLDSIKEWLNSMNIKYYESRLNLNWKPILQNIMDDPQSFLESGGWEFLNIEGGSDSDSEGSEESEAYEPSDVDEASESEDESEDDESVVDSEEDDEEGEEGEEGEEEEEGMTWEELEEKARKEDKEKGEESDSEEERARRKAKGGVRRQTADSRGMGSGRGQRPGGMTQNGRPGMAGGRGPRPGVGPSQGSRPGMGGRGPPRSGMAGQGSAKGSQGPPKPGMGSRPGMAGQNARPSGGVPSKPSSQAPRPGMTRGSAPPRRPPPAKRQRM